MKKTICVLTFLFILLIGTQVFAIPVLILDDPATSDVDLTITDIDEDGFLNYVGSLSGTVWGVNVTTGLTSPLMGSETEPHMDLNTVNVSSGGGGVLNLYFYDEVSEGGPAFYTNEGLVGYIGGTTNGSVSASVWRDTYWNNSPPDGIYGTIMDFGTFGPGAFSGTEFYNDSHPEGINLLLYAQITHTGAGQVTSFDLEVANPVPEPATMLLLGTGLIGLAGAGRKKLFKK